MKTAIQTLVFGLLILLAGCAWWFPPTEIKQNGSIVDYLYPDTKEVPVLQPGVTYLKPPVRVGVAFVPGSGWTDALPEVEKEKLLERVKASFKQYDYIGTIEIIPTQYLRPRGGFANLEQVARMFNVEVVTLLSYDQVQFNDSNKLSMLYWTIVGAYVIHGNQYDIQTMLDASVFDVRSHKLLFRAPGTSQVSGSAPLVGLNEEARAARLSGYNKAVETLIPQLQSQLGQFKARLNNDASIKVENKPGYQGGGDFGWLSVLIALALTGIAYRARQRN